MNNDRLVLLVQADALRDDYVTECESPFLWQLCQGGIYGSLQPTFGFESDAAYFAGLYPDESDGGAHYWYAPESTPFGIARYLPRLFDCLTPLSKRVLRRILTAYVRRIASYRYESIANIPLKVLPFFAPVQRYLPYEPGYLNHPTIFSVCGERGIPWLFHASPSHPVRIKTGLERLRRDLKPPIRFAFWQIGDLDTAGHRYGPFSSERKEALRRIDAGIQSIHLQIKNLYKRIDWVIIGDHGMVDVRYIVDVHGNLCQTGIRQRQGVLYFLDSTMARFWFFEEKMKYLVISSLEKIRGGRILGQADLDRYHLNYPHNRFGELFFLAEPGVLFLPNFYQDVEIVKGMHGYAPEFSANQSAFIINSPCITESRHLKSPIDMRRIYPTVLKLLALNKSHICKLQSIV